MAIAIITLRPFHCFRGFGKPGASMALLPQKYLEHNSSRGYALAFDRVRLPADERLTQSFVFQKLYGSSAIQDAAEQGSAGAAKTR
jgi:hypothetical protein